MATKKRKQLTVNIDPDLDRKLRMRLAKLGKMQRGNLTPAIEGALDCFLSTTDKNIIDRINERSKNNTGKTKKQ